MGQSTIGVVRGQGERARDAKDAGRTRRSPVRAVSRAVRVGVAEARRTSVARSAVRVVPRLDRANAARGGDRGRTIFMSRPQGWPIPPAAPRTATLYPRVCCIALEAVRETPAARRRAAMVCRGRV